MLSKLIFEITPPITNTSSNSRGRHSTKFHMMTEDNSLFEALIKDMNHSQTQIERMKLRCENPNCKSVFCVYDKCISCVKTYCSSCLLKCDMCSQATCKFCLEIIYEKFQDQQICPSCKCH